MITFSSYVSQIASPACIIFTQESVMTQSTFSFQTVNRTNALTHLLERILYSNPTRKVLKFRVAPEATSCTGLNKHQRVCLGAQGQRREAVLNPSFWRHNTRWSK